MTEKTIFCYKDVKIFYITFMFGITLSSCNAISSLFLRTNNEFSITLYHQLMNSQKENFVYGIFPLDAMIALTYLGTEGDVAKDIRSALAWNASDDQIKQDFETAIKEIEHLPHCKIHLSNRIYAANRLNLNPKFSEIASYFDTNIVKMDFSAAKQAAENINLWAVNRTHKKIGNWVDEKLFTPETDIVYVNNIFLRSKWQNEFDKKHTTKMDFHLSPNETVKVDMMKISGNYMVSRHPELKIKMVKIPYQNEKVYMLIILADGEFDPDYIVKNARNFWYQRNFTSQYISLYVPKFEVTSIIDVIPALKTMGVTKLFSSEIRGFAKEPVKLSVITQKIFVNVNERGTAADDTSIVEKKGTKKHDDPKDEGEIFKVDHPFIFGLLYDDFSLIFGRIQKL